MENDEYRINGRYRFSSRLKGEVEATLFNDYFLSVHTQQMKRSRDFKLELATLDPAAEHVVDHAIRWLAAAALCSLGTIIILYLLFTGAAGDGNMLIPLLGILITMLLGAGFTALYFYTSQHKWVISTRAARYPLLELPYTKTGREEARAFVTQLQQAIENNVTKRNYSSDDLFAGEMRMLRRLAKNRILSMAVYDHAKAHMLKSHQQTTA